MAQMKSVAHQDSHLKADNAFSLMCRLNIWIILDFLSVNLITLKSFWES